ncbi:extracellular serine-threonine rich protein [Diaporthe amygdali]|uniref:extracellular serine-threonine rich protein n=1 Tax=Phomopsis amygdali TaxID=1214568 RepID=UPI0022FE9D78|nr:extracellular serine-threonine rich protein [Diaporthe amygdali]KAJ0123143.1 extracellular serine-threonine rich protein [Diaporthe amygdali]
MKLSLFTLTFVTGTALATWGSGGDEGGDDNCKDSGDKGGWKRLINGRTWGHGGGDKDCTTTTEGSGYETQPPKGEHTKSHHSGGGGGGQMTYSTIYATSTQTITSCAPEITDCPGEQYTTVTVAVSTTLCPVTETSPIPVVTPPVATPPAQTTSVITPSLPPVVSSVKPTTSVVVPPAPVTTPATLSTRTTGRPSATIPVNGTTTATRPPVVTAGAASNGVSAGVALAALFAAVI